MVRTLYPQRSTHMIFSYFELLVILSVENHTGVLLWTPSSLLSPLWFYSLSHLTISMFVGAAARGRGGVASIGTGFPAFVCFIGGQAILLYGVCQDSSSPS